MLIAIIACRSWVYLFAAHGRFWLSTPELPAATPAHFPDVDVIVPARNEAATIAPVIASLLAQDYGGRFLVTLVDDASSDGTACVAGSAPALKVIQLLAKPAGWSGKLWALSAGAAATQAPFILLTDADIVHDPRHLSSLVSKMLSSGSALVSEMVHLNCVSLAERALIPAFVYFFQLLYPFAKVNDRRSRVAAAAGGSILIRRAALQQIGGIEAIKGTLIDDVALASAVKRHAPIFLGHSALARSIRPYPRFSDIWQMIARTAFTQLHFSAALLGVTLMGLTLVWLIPPCAAIFGSHFSRALGVATCGLAAVTFLPTLRRYRRSPLWTLALPVIAAFFMAATLASAMNYWLGAGARWKDRMYEGENQP